jgi:hypothetical protein
MRTISVESPHPDFADATLEFGAGDSVTVQGRPAVGTRRVRTSPADNRRSAHPVSSSHQLLKPTLSR